MIDVPSSPETLSADWLTSALREAGVIRRSVVSAVDVSGSGLAQGITSRIVRLYLRYDPVEEGSIPSLIVKCASSSDRTRAIGNSSGMYEREVMFYRVMAGRTQICTPRCYYGAYDPVSGRSILLLQDLKAFCNGDPTTGANLGEVRLAVAAAARFHAAWWDKAQLDEFTWLTRFDGARAQERSARFAASWPVFCTRWGHLLPEPVRSLGERMLTDQVSLTQRLGRSPTTLVHNDYQLGNLYYDESSPQTLPVVADWQLAGRGRGPCDIAQLLASSFTPEDRRAHELELLNEYHALLVDQGARGYSFDECLTDYRLGLVNSFARVVSVAGGGFVPSDEAMARYLPVLMRRVAAVMDANPDDLMAPWSS